MNATHGPELFPLIFPKEQNRIHSLEGNHVAGVATRLSGAQQVEMWVGRMEAGSGTPPHNHDTEEVVHILRGSGRALVAGREMHYRSGDTLILPAGHVHQIFADTESEFVSAMPMGGTVTLADGTLIDLPWRR
jgi:quercetin dioxygenase-like cupin family protein